MVEGDGDPLGWTCFGSREPTREPKSLGIQLLRFELTL